MVNMQTQPVRVSVCFFFAARVNDVNKGEREGWCFCFF